MRCLSLLSSALMGFTLAATVSATPVPPQNAPVIEDNDPDLVYQVKLLDKDNTTVTGQFTAWATKVGVGIKIHAEVSGLPNGDLHYPYHIHEKPVPEDGNCYATGAHLDPYKRGDDPPCDIKAPQTCQVGDLSGKHGPIFAPDDETYEVFYTDYYLSNQEEDPAFFGNLSIVVHAPNNTRLNCGNFVPLNSLKSEESEQPEELQPEELEPEKSED
ncbi:putative cytosolic Cu/Zn superoxide dismutase [Aspergillus melleus]|uniref:putative cytosolic Cu/Zn superoxide dismutase n=1 Tax=Aspergillus melleus TaxID=138277 RepID=UPI001E8EC82D|nr:Cell surface superoxide dismutase [Cu-Zn] 4 [Aspergillus melleus]KAH8426034.1 Cell surface superoxide dismutase [Cu-Zn] 4 [Aspergillus melleus]